MTWRDAAGYKCCSPPAWMRVSDQHKRYPDKVNDGPRLSEAELATTVAYLLAGHTAVEAGQHFGIHPTSVKHRMHAAGYSYDAKAHAWGVW